MRRIVDIAISSVALLLVSPLLVAVALAIKLSSPGQVLYRARRVGRGRQTFDMLKFRSMTRKSGGADHLPRMMIRACFPSDGSSAERSWMNFRSSSTCYAERWRSLDRGRRIPPSSAISIRTGCWRRSTSGRE